MLISWLLCCKKLSYFWCCGYYLNLRSGCYVTGFMIMAIDILMIIYWFIRAQLFNFTNINLSDIENSIGSYFRSFVMMFFALQAIAQVFDILLLVGTCYNYKRLLYIWLASVLYLRIIIIPTVGFAVTVFYAINGFWYVTLGKGIALTFLEGLIIYGFIVVYSYYLSVGDKSKEHTKVPSSNPQSLIKTSSFKKSDEGQDEIISLMSLTRSETSNAPSETVTLYRCASHAAGKPQLEHRESFRINVNFPRDGIKEEIDNTEELTPTEVLMGMGIINFRHPHAKIISSQRKTM